MILGRVGIYPDKNNRQDPLNDLTNLMSLQTTVPMEGNHLGEAGGTGMWDKYGFGQTID